MTTWRGNALSFEIEGASHAPCMTGTLIGLPAGVTYNPDELAAFMARRAPGQNAWSTPRKEADAVEVLGGVADDTSATDGAAVRIRIANTNTRARDYERENIPRPGHADFAYFAKTGNQIESGGGAFSGRLTAPLCALGFFALQALKERGVTVTARIAQIGSVACDSAEVTEELANVIAEARGDRDSVGGKVRVVIDGVPAGKGAGYFNGLDVALGGAFFGIPAVKAVEFGAGTRAAELRGSQNNDPFVWGENGVETLTNNHGGLLGGITSGMPIEATLTFKPTPSIAREQRSVNLDTREDVELVVRGRHDPCIVPRALPVVEAVAGIVVLDMLLAEERASLATLAQARQTLDAIDNQIAELFTERMSVVERVPELKALEGVAVDVPGREAAILERLTAGASVDDAEALRRLYATIFEISKDHQRKSQEE